MLVHMAVAKKMIQKYFSQTRRKIFSSFKSLNNCVVLAQLLLVLVPPMASWSWMKKKGSIAYRCSDLPWPWMGKRRGKSWETGRWERGARMFTVIRSSNKIIYFTSFVTQASQTTGRLLFMESQKLIEYIYNIWLKWWLVCAVCVHELLKIIFCKYSLQHSD